METGSSRKFERIINLLLFAISLIPVLIFIFVTIQRIAIPIDLEWGEGAGVNQIQRILSGQSLYVEPTIEFSPLVYAPLYYYLSAGLAFLIQPIFLAGRMVSVIATAASAFLLYRLVNSRSRTSLAGWFSAAFFIACFPLTDGFFDLVRVDALYVFLSLAGLATFLKGRTLFSFLLAGSLVVVSFFVKQSAVIVFLPLVLYLLIRNWKSAWILLPVILLGILVPSMAANAYSGGWFGYYIYGLPREHGFSLLSAVNFWPGDLIRYMGLALGFSIAYVVLIEPGDHENSEMSPAKRSKGASSSKLDDSSVIILFAVGALGASWITRSSNGGGANNIMLACAVIALLFGLGIDRVRQMANGGTGERRRIELLLPILIALQFIGMFYNPYRYLPTADEITANERLSDAIRMVDGEVLIPYRSDLPARLGKQPAIHAVNLFELTGYFLGEEQPAGRAIISQIQRRICNQEYGLVVLDQPMPWFQEQIDLAYLPDPAPLMPLTDRRSQQLEWQDGYDELFIPRQGYQMDNCLDTISPVDD